MPIKKISKELNSSTYFLTFTIKKWYYLFDRHNRWNIIAESLRFCQKKKGLKLYGFVFMLNHIHLITESCDTSGFVRDFKRHTSREIHKNIVATEPNIEKLFVETDETYSIWQDTNMPIILQSEKFFQQKLNYILENPVRKNYVSDSSFWYWSSANEKCELKTDNVNE
ncbi:MAG: transposase [Candidatus Paceibacterota bacterium]|jgi:REP element-mobilizing transposase RayT|nr:transposase [Candidatus Paceibacterota bacterium]